MIRVNIIENKAVIDSIVDNADENTLVAWAQEDEKSHGYCVFDKSGEIKEVIEKEDVFELLIRATLNSLDLRGVKEGYCNKKSLFPKLKMLGFKESGDRCFTDINEFFKPCCSK